MSLFVATLLALSAQPVPHIYFVGGSLSVREQAELRMMLGKSARVDFADVGRIPPKATADTVIVSLWQDTNGPSWNSGLDRFVPATKARLTTLAKRFPKSRRLVLLNQARSEADRSELVPLLSQAARESGWAVLDLNRSALKGTRARKLYALLVPSHHGNGSWRVLSATSEETGEGPARNAIDGNPDTYWHTRWSSNPTKVPHEIVVDLGSRRSLAGFSYLARQDGGVNGRVKGFELYVSENKGAWGAPVIKGDLQSTPIEQRLLFERPVHGRFLRFRALSEVNGNIWTTCAELGILTSGA